MNINTCSTPDDFKTYLAEVNGLGLKPVFQVTMNQFAVSASCPLYSNSYATCIGIVVEGPKGGALAHVDPLAVMDAKDLVTATNLLYGNTIARMLQQVGTPAGVLLFASKYSRDKSADVDIHEPLVDKLVALYGKGAISGVWDYRTHPARPASAPEGVELAKNGWHEARGFTNKEHFSHVLYVPENKTAYLIQDHISWIKLHEALKDQIAKVAAKQHPSDDSLRFTRKNSYAQQLTFDSGSRKMVPAE